MIKKILYESNSKKNGFIMLEVTVATVIIAVALVAIIAMFIQSQKVNKDSSEYVFATNLAQTQLELLKTKAPSYWAGFATLPSSIPWQDSARQPGNGASPNVIITEKNIAYTVTTEVQMCPESTSLVQVVVVVSWMSQTGTRSITMTADYRKI